MKLLPLVMSSSKVCKVLWNNFSYQKENAPPVVWEFSDGQGSHVKHLLLSRHKICAEKDKDI